MHIPNLHKKHANFENMLGRIRREKLAEIFNVFLKDFGQRTPQNMQILKIWELFLATKFACFTCKFFFPQTPGLKSKPQK